MDYKYKPTKITDIIGNKQAIKDIVDWLHSWDTNSVSDIKYKSMFIHGPFGVGKTATINILLKDYNTIEINPEDECSKLLISVTPIIKTKKNIFGKSNIILVNDVDGILDSGIMSKLNDIIKTTCIPIVIIGNDKYNKHLKSVLPLCIQIKFTQPSVMEIFNYIKQIIKSEKIRMTDNTLRECIIQCKQDIRQILIMLDFPKISKDPDNIPNSIFESTRRFMSQLTSIEDKYDIYKYENSDILPLMVQENYIPNLIINSKDQVNTLDNMYQSSVGLSDYDICYGNYAGLLIASNNSHVKSTVQFTKYYNTISTYTKRHNIIDIYNIKFNTKSFRVEYFSYIIHLIMKNDNYINLVNTVIYFGLTQEDIQDKCMDLLLKTDVYMTYMYDSLNKNIKGNITKYFNTLRKNIQSSSTQITKKINKTTVIKSPSLKKKKDKTTTR
jgi:hypothetical protein